jgi:MOSC domain-containing protein YiiM
MELRLLSVNVARPRIIGAVHGEPVLSGIDKHPLTAGTVFVGATDIVGDEQADLSVHGGVDKAVYAYPSDHWPWWEREHGLSCAPATMGENLTLAGADESHVHIGDRFRWGDALLEVSQPRGPCYKLAIHTRRADAPQIMTLSARCGWYYRVLEQGDAAVGAPLVRVHKSASTSVRDAFRAATHPNIEYGLRAAVLAAPALAQSWRFAVEKRGRDRSDSNI